MPGEIDVVLPLEDAREMMREFKRAHPTAATIGEFVEPTPLDYILVHPAAGKVLMAPLGAYLRYIKSAPWAEQVARSISRRYARYAGKSPSWESVLPRVSQLMDTASRFVERAVPEERVSGVSLRGSFDWSYSPPRRAIYYPEAGLSYDIIQWLEGKAPFRSALAGFLTPLGHESGHHFVYSYRPAATASDILDSLARIRRRELEFDIADAFRRGWYPPWGVRHTARLYNFDPSDVRTLAMIRLRYLLSNPGELAGDVVGFRFLGVPPSRILPRAFPEEGLKREVLKSLLVEK